MRKRQVQFGGVSGGNTCPGGEYAVKVSTISASLGWKYLPLGGFYGKGKYNFCESRVEILAWEGIMLEGQVNPGWNAGDRQ